MEDTETGSMVGFIKDIPELSEYVCPNTIVVQHGYENAFVTEVSDSCSMRLSHVQFSK